MTHDSQDGGPSQSLFQVYYLGATLVDRRCSSSVMPWIVEELKLKTQEMKLLWLTPGKDTLGYVADSGQELFSHSYSSILQCCVAVDGISLAYVARNENDNKYYCHVFQSLTYDEAKAIMAKFKVHAREEVSVGSIISQDNTSDLPSKLPGFIFPSSRKHHPPDSKPLAKPQRSSEYQVDFIGKFEVSAPSTTKETQVQSIDKLVFQLKEEHHKKLFKGKKGFGSLIRQKFSSSSLKDNSDNEGDVSKQHESTSSISSNVSIEAIQFELSNSLSTDDVQNGDSSHQISKAEGNTLTENGVTDKRSHRISVISNTSTEFDTLPELSSLQQMPSFQSLSSVQVLPSRGVVLVFSGTVLTLLCQETNERILKKSIRNIACCGQGKKEPEFFAFTSTSRDGADKKYYCHLFRAENKKTVFKILSSFQSSFFHALSVGMPAALCASCPLQQLHSLCKKLEGVSTQVGQSIIQDCLTSLPEADNADILKQYKHSEHADHEYTQIIVLVGLIRQYFFCRQESHTHPGTGLVTSLSDPAPSRLLPALTRAKNAIASSFENLKNKQSDRNRSKSPEISSTLFSKKATLDTLLSPIPASPLKQMSIEEVQRSRTWSGFSRKSRHSDVVGSVTVPEKPAEPVKPVDDSPSPVLVQTPPAETALPFFPSSKPSIEVGEYSTPKQQFKNPSTPVRKVKTLPRPVSLRGVRGGRHSSWFPSQRQTTITPEIADKKFRTHRRATSFVTTTNPSSWRQELFEICQTPDQKKLTNSSEIIDDFEIISMDQYKSMFSYDCGPHKTKYKGESPRVVARKRWADAINQQLILIRMEKFNSQIKTTLLTEASDDAELRRVKLNYSTPDLECKETIARWNTVLADPTSFTDEDLRILTLKGIPPSKRSEVWPLLTQRYQASNDPDWSLPSEVDRANGLTELLNEETEYENNIVLDLARSFPRHPYFRPPMEGQRSLKNVLYSYAVADRETGYCQGLSFVTGILLLHSENELKSFELLYKLMTLYKYRQLYFDNLVNLQMRLYQLSRLLHDYEPALYQHFKDCDITPFFYAAPWLMTIFASEFPLTFIARVFDMIFLEGTEIIFKVVLAMLHIHEEAILNCQGMEATCKYLKTSIPKLAMEHIEETFEIASKLSFDSRFSTFEAEYHMMAELNSSFKSDLVINDFHSVADVLKNQNVALIEQLAICRAQNNRLLDMVQTLQTQMSEQTERIMEQNEKIIELETRLEAMESSRHCSEDEQSVSSMENLTTDSSSTT